MRSRWNWVGAGFGVLLASLSFFMRHSGSAATGYDLASMLRPGDDQIVVAQNGDNAAKPAARPAAKPKTPAAKPSTPAAPEAETPAGAPQAAPDPLGELQPVLHAQGAKITTCMDTIINQASSVIDTAHTAISTWVT